jgi:hypothetical protein
MVGNLKLALVLGSALALASCQDGAGEPTSSEVASKAANPLPLFGDGYPKAGDPCRRVGESEATVNYLDDSADLVGCPDAASAQALGGTVVENIDGTVLVSVPRLTSPTGAEGDALVAGTAYNATAEIECSGYRKHPAGRCPAGVKRNQEDGLTIVEIQWPAGDSRALFFKDGKILSANTNQADGSAAFDVVGEREGDVTTVRIGPERYVIPDAFIQGG